MCTGAQVTLVSGEVIGSVLVCHDRPLHDDEPERIAETVREPFAVLANLRNLAIAESRRYRQRDHRRATRQRLRGTLWRRGIPGTAADTDSAGARTVAEKIGAAIVRITLSHVPRLVTASLGVATYPDDADDGDTLVRRADHALYAAEAAGRNRVEVAQQSITRR